jgi:hypothetical protein
MSTILALSIDAPKMATIKRGQAHYWAVCRDLDLTVPGRPITVQDILNRSSCTDHSTVRGFLILLARAGIAQQEAGAKPPAWRLLKRPTRLPRLNKYGKVVRSGTEAMWNAIRALTSFEASELALSASTEERPIALETAKTYCRRLFEAGYLKETRTGTPGRPAVYRLKPGMNTGPLPPQILRTKLVFDQNRGEIMGLATAEEVEP